MIVEKSSSSIRLLNDRDIRVAKLITESLCLAEIKLFPEVVVCDSTKAVEAQTERARANPRLFWRQIFNEKDPLYDTSMYVDGQTARVVFNRSRIGKVKVIKQTVFEKEYNLILLVPLDESQIEEVYYPNQLEVCY